MCVLANQTLYLSGNSPSFVRGEGLRWPGTGPASSVANNFTHVLGPANNNFNDRYIHGQKPSCQYKKKYTKKLMKIRLTVIIIFGGYLVFSRETSDLQIRLRPSNELVRVCERRGVAMYSLPEYT